MITDNNLVLSGTNVPGSAITGQGSITTSGVVSTNTIDLGTARDVGEGEELFAVFTVIGTFTAGSMTSLTIDVITSANADLSSSTAIASKTIAAGSIASGSQFVIAIPPNVGSLGQRYLGAKYTAVGANPTALNVLGQVVHDIQDGRKSYTSGFLVV